MRKKTYYLGLCVTYHDSALAIVDETGEPLFAEATERSLQYKRAINCEPDAFHRLPELLRRHCPDAGRFVVAFNWRKRRPLYERAAAAVGLLRAGGVNRAGFKRLRSPLENRHIHHMMACNRLAIAQGGLNLSRVLGETCPDATAEFRDFDHHDTHAALACYASPFRDAACAVLDSYGENGSTAFYRFRSGRLEPLRKARGLGSLGLYYMYVTSLCGFDWMQGEEWKVMGLAPYGKLDQEIYRLLQDVIRVKGLGLEHPRGRLFPALAKLETHRRKAGQEPGQWADLAFTGQYFFAEIMAEILSNFHAIHPCDRLALAGGCALNSSFNGQIAASTPFKDIYVPPAPADDGTALGAAWLALIQDRPGEHMIGLKTPMTPYLGSSFSADALERMLRFGGGLEVRQIPDGPCTLTARLLASGKLVAWAQGRAEFGPRALGNRSILADPRDPGMKDRINALVKFREEYRPFAPSILHEHGHDYFEDYQEAPYMERALRFREEVRARVPAVAHVDGTGRLQTVKQDWNPRFHRLLSEFHRITGVPILLNTSFNVMGKPIVHSVEDAVAVFMTCGLDALVIEDWLFAKPGVL